MSAVFESRLSDSPYIEIIWRGYVERDYSPVCPADAHWNLLFTRQHGRIRVSVEGPTTRSILKTLAGAAVFLFINLRLGTIIPMSHFLPGTFVNGNTVLPKA